MCSHRCMHVGWNGFASRQVALQQRDQIQDLWAFVLCGLLLAEAKLKNQPNGREGHQYEGRVSRLCWNWPVFSKCKLMIKSGCRQTHFLKSTHLERDIDAVYGNQTLQYFWENASFQRSDKPSICYLPVQKMLALKNQC